MSVHSVTVKRADAVVVGDWVNVKGVGLRVTTIVNEKSSVWGELVTMAFADASHAQTYPADARVEVADA